MAEQHAPGLDEHISRLCQDVLKAKGWHTFRDVNIQLEEHIGPTALGAYLTLHDRRINVTVGPDLPASLDALNARERLEPDGNAILEPAIYFTMLHEHGHHQYCPATREGVERLIQGTFDAIQGQECSVERIQQACMHLQNMFSDTVENAANSHLDDSPERFRRGFSYMYLLDCHRGQRLTRKKTEKGMTLFLNTNNYLCQTDAGLHQRTQKYLPKFFLGSGRYERRILDIFTGDPALTAAVTKRELSTDATEALVGRLLDQSQWKQMAYEYAAIMYPFIRRSQEPPGCRHGKDPQQEGNGKGQSGQQGKPGKGQQQGGKAGPGQPRPKDGKDSQGASKDSSKGPQAPHGPPTPGPAGSQLKDIVKNLLGQYQHAPGSSPFLNHYGHLDQLYRERSGKIRLLAEDEQRESPHHELPLSREQVPKDEFSISGIDWSASEVATRPDGSRHVQLYRKNAPIILPFPTGDRPGGLPDISFIFDSSGSMIFQPFEGEGQGEYDLAVKAVYAILNYLESEGLAGLLNYHVINFSSQTHASGWRGYGEIDAVKRALFDYHGGGTELDPLALARLRDTRRDSFISFMLSDTQFNEEKNARACIKEVEAMKATGGIGLYLFNLGPPTPFSTALEELAVPVQYIRRAEDFLHASIRFTKDLYGRLEKP